MNTVESFDLTELFKRERPLEKKLKVTQAQMNIIVDSVFRREKKDAGFKIFAINDGTKLKIIGVNEFRGYRKAIYVDKETLTVSKFRSKIEGLLADYNLKYNPVEISEYDD